MHVALPKSALRSAGLTGALAIAAITTTPAALAAPGQMAVPAAYVAASQSPTTTGYEAPSDQPSKGQDTLPTATIYSAACKNGEVTVSLTLTNFGNGNASFSIQNQKGTHASPSDVLVAPGGSREINATLPKNSAAVFVRWNNQTLASHSVEGCGKKSSDSKSSASPSFTATSSSAPSSTSYDAGDTRDTGGGDGTSNTSTALMLGGSALAIAAGLALLLRGFRR